MMATKETLIIFWLSIYKPDKWEVRYTKDASIFTVIKGGRTLYIEYRFNTVNYVDECIVSGSRGVEDFGTVEECLKGLR